MDDFRERLRRLSLGDEALLETVLANERANRIESGLDAKTHALVRFAATVAIDAGPVSYQHAVTQALAAGTTADELVGTLVAVMSLTGVPRAVCAAPKLGLALGYDIEAALERLEP
jgi:4-carboxymuconolactone decarboxylase